MQSENGQRRRSGAPSFLVLSDTLLSVVVPASSPSTVDVQVGTTAGYSAQTPWDLFTFWSDPSGNGGPYSFA